MLRIVRFIRVNWQVVVVLLVGLVLVPFLWVHKDLVSQDRADPRSQGVRLPTDVGYILP